MTRAMTRAISGPAADPLPGAGAAADGTFAPLAYRLRWQPGGARPGAHPAARDGGDGSFRRLVGLLEHPDPRRIDVRASLRDPFEAVRVRAFAPRRAVTVVVLLDLSASMAFGGLSIEAARLAAVLAASAEAGGDAFALAAADAAIREDLLFPPGRRRGLAPEVFERLSAAPPRGRSAAGLRAAAERLPARRSLVFLVSDFLMPEAERSGLLDTLWRHDVVPVVMRDSRAEGDLPAFGLMEADDLETGRRRLVVLRPSLRARWREAAQARLATLEADFAARGRRAFHIVDRFEPDALVRYLTER